MDIFVLQTVHISLVFDYSTDGKPH